MEKFIITTGKTLDLAIAAALEELKLDRTGVSVEVLEQPKSGFLGFGAQPAKVKVTYEAPGGGLAGGPRYHPHPLRTQTAAARAAKAGGPAGGAQGGPRDRASPAPSAEAAQI